MAHDGFTLHDLVSYDHKHNANGEDNRDGDNHNLSWSCGCEGPTDDPAIGELRERQKRNFIATLMLSQGVPMISGGDERSRTQHGNNNAYCQDNEISWTDWTITDRKRAFLDFRRRAIQLGRTQPVLRRRRFLQGHLLRDAAKDVMWLAPSGQEMSDAEWNADHVKCLGVRLSGDATDEVDSDGAPIRRERLLYLMNASEASSPFILPSFVGRPRWETVLETFDDRRVGELREGGTPYPLAAHSLAVMRLHSHGTLQQPS